MRFNTKKYVSKCIASNSLTKVNVNKCIMGDTRRYNSNGVRELVYFVVYEMIRFQCYFTIRIVSCKAIFMQIIKMFGILYYFFYIIFFCSTSTFGWIFSIHQQLKCTYRWSSLLSSHRTKTFIRRAKCQLQSIRKTCDSL